MPFLLENRAQKVKDEPKNFGEAAPLLISNFSFRSSKNPALHKGEAGLLIIMIYYSHSMVLGGLEVMS